MSATTPADYIWDSLEYQQIVSAPYQDGQIVVGFTDGGNARLSPHILVSPVQPDLDWPNLRAEDFHIVVPGAAGEVEIPWDVIRVHSDPAYDAFWADLAGELAVSESNRRAKLAG